MPRAVVRSLLALPLGLLLVIPSSGWSQPGTLFIHQIDVGQGDASLIISPARVTLLIDAGNNGKGRAKVVPLLRRLGLNKLDLIVASHYDADHIGGLDEVINSLERVGAVLDRGDSGTQARSETTSVRSGQNAAQSRSGLDRHYTA